MLTVSTHYNYRENIPQFRIMHAFHNDWEKIKGLFASEDKSDFVKANDLLEAQGIDCAKKDELIEELNYSFPNWHFFMSNCLIRRVKASYYSTGFMGK